MSGHHCEECAHAYDEREEGDDHPSWRCGYAVPFWVPLHVSDYCSLVNSHDGTDCRVFKEIAEETKK